jgi:hypothetical protein
MATFLYPPVSVTTLPPLGGATSANQLIEIAALQSIDGKTPALVGGKVPVDTGLTQPLTDTQLRATPVPVSGPLTDTQLRATPVPVSGTVSVSNFPATQPVSGPLTDAQLRATPVPVSGTVTANAGTNLNTSALNLEATQALIKAKTDNLDVLLSTRASNADLLLMSAKLPATLGQKTMANSMAIVIASDQSTITVKSEPPSVVGTDQTQNCDETTGATFTKPANAKNMVIFNNAGDPVANRVRIGQAPAWPSTGALLGVGNSTALLPASTFKAIAENNSSNANVTVLWFY